MKRWLVIFCGLLAIPAWADDWRTTLSPVQPGSFPPLRPLRAVYRFGWSGIPAAEATFDYGKGVPGRLRLTMNTKTIGGVRALWKMDAQHKAICQAATLRPISLEETVSYQRETETVQATFSPEGVRRQTKVTPLAGPQEKEKRFKCPGLFDLHTALLFIRSQRLQVGDRYRLAVYPSTSAYLAEIEVLGREKLKVAGSSREAIKCQLRLQKVTKKGELAPHKKFKRAFAWISDDRDRLMLKIEAEIFVGSVWAELQSIEYANATAR